jgi:hypothetical protein
MLNQVLQITAYNFQTCLTPGENVTKSVARSCLENADTARLTILLRSLYVHVLFL